MSQDDPQQSFEPAPAASAEIMRQARAYLAQLSSDQLRSWQEEARLWGKSMEQLWWEFIQSQQAPQQPVRKPGIFDRIAGISAGNDLYYAQQQLQYQQPQQPAGLQLGSGETELYRCMFKRVSGSSNFYMDKEGVCLVTNKRVILTSDSYLQFSLLSIRSVTTYTNGLLFKSYLVNIRTINDAWYNIAVDSKEKQGALCSQIITALHHMA